MKQRRVTFGAAPMDEVLAEAVRAGLVETGGVLLGRNDGANVEVTHVVGPGPLARHSRTAFEPDYEWQEARIADFYRAADRRLAYLGDWHTHPGGTTRPSRRDERTLRTIASFDEARCPDPVMLICASPSNGVWQSSTYMLANSRPRRRRVVRVPLHVRAR